MTFTDLELVLMASVVVLIVINYSLNKVLNVHRQAHVVIMSCINGVADNKAVFTRGADGTISCKLINSTENSNGTSQQT
jgi:hypothetical protein